MRDDMVWINFRATKEERERLRKDAHRHEMTMTEYVKWLIDKQRNEDIVSYQYRKRGNEK